ncbi:MAG: peptide chain release factor N(5)-glutamine methyltransferase [Candidatus Omnitrophota bacterium]
MKLKDWFKENKQVFNDTDLRFLVKNAFSQKVSILEEDKSITDQKEQYLEKVKRSYLEGVPLAYILGKEEFFGLEFKVSKDVLIPRRETELIVEKALNIILEHNLSCVLDLCCGCANIAVSIKKQGPKNLQVYACDDSLKALKIAAINTGFHRAEVTLAYSDLLSGFKKSFFDLIVTNPPYVEDKNIKGTLEYEPRSALAGGEDGLDYIKRILKDAPTYLKNGGYLIAEIGYKHKNPVEKIICNIGKYNIIEWIKDYSGHWRGVVLKLRTRDEG